MTKHILRRFREGGIPAADEAIRTEAAELFATEDLQNAVRTFLEHGGPGHADVPGPLSRAADGPDRLRDARSPGMPNVDFDAIAKGLAMAVPFAGHLGLEITEVGRGRGDRRPAAPARAQQPRRLPARRRPLHRRRDRLRGGLRRRLRERMGDVTPLARSRRDRLRKDRQRARSRPAPRSASTPGRGARHPRRARARSSSPARSCSPTRTATGSPPPPSTGTCGSKQAAWPQAVRRSAGSRRVDQKDARTSRAATRKASFSASSCASS